MATPTDEQLVQLSNSVVKLIEDDKMIQDLRQTKVGALDREYSTRHVASTPSFASVKSGHVSPLTEFNIMQFLQPNNRELSFERLSHQIKRLSTRTIWLRQCFHPTDGSFIREKFDAPKPKKLGDTLTDIVQLISQANHYMDITKSIIYILSGNLIMD